MIKNELYDLIHSGESYKASQWLEARPDDLNSDIADGYTPLHVACLFGEESIAKALVSRGAIVNANAKNDSAATPLHLATAFRDEQVAKRIVLFLLEAGAELNAKQRGGQTALHHAVARGSLPLVETLITEGADPFLKDDQSRSPGDLARDLKSEDAESIRSELKRAFSLPLEIR